MRQKSNNGLSLVDVIAFLAIFVIGVMVFFGFNFYSLGDKLTAAIVAVGLTVALLVMVWLAAYARRQDRNQETWATVAKILIGLYVALLLPCYFFGSKFVDLQIGRAGIEAQATEDVADIDAMFADYSRKCESRTSAYITTLEAEAKSATGRQRLARLLDIDTASITSATVSQAGESFIGKLKGPDYQALDAQRAELSASLLQSVKA